MKRHNSLFYVLIPATRRYRGSHRESQSLIVGRNHSFCVATVILRCHRHRGSQSLIVGRNHSFCVAITHFALPPSSWAATVIVGRNQSSWVAINHRGSIHKVTPYFRSGKSHLAPKSLRSQNFKTSCNNQNFKTSCNNQKWELVATMALSTRVSCTSCTTTLTRTPNGLVWGGRW
jgi:hypothetical protein